MKKITMLISTLLIGSFIYGQQNPTGPSIPNSTNVASKAGHAWFRGGNQLGGQGGNKNIFGTMWDSPIYTYTDGINRMVVNRTNVNYAGIPTPGYIGIGFNPTDIRSRLTITGTNNTTFGGGGYRSWMKTGVFNLENSDQLYIGMKPEGNNRSDAFINHEPGKGTK